MDVRRAGRPTVVALAIISTLTAIAAIAASTASANLLAPGSKCAGQQNTHASEHEQEHAMQCLLNYARQHSGGGNLDRNRPLERAAGRKVGDVMRGGPSHTACGHPADAYAESRATASSGSGGTNGPWVTARGRIAAIERRSATLSARARQLTP